MFVLSDVKLDMLVLVSSSTVQVQVILKVRLHLTILFKRSLVKNVCKKLGVC